MLVARIDLTHMHYSGSSHRHVGKIHLVGPDADMTLNCAAYLAPDEPENAVAAALISDAIRQVHRTPEFRRLKNPVTLAPGAIPEIARQFR